MKYLIYILNWILEGDPAYNTRYFRIRREIRHQQYIDRNNAEVTSLLEKPWGQGRSSFGTIN